MPPEPTAKDLRTAAHAQRGLQPFDILVLARLLAGGHIGDVDGASLSRLRSAQLLVGDRVAGSRCLEFLEHAVKYIVPAEVGDAIVPGMLTSVDVEPLASAFPAGGTPWVWAHSDGAHHGRSISPVAPEAPYLAAQDPELHAVLAAVDALRVGHARERRVAKEYLTSRLVEVGAFASVA